MHARQQPNRACCPVQTLALPLSKMISNDLMTQITSMERDVFVAAYKEIMRATLTGSRITPEEKRLLREYRARVRIPAPDRHALPLTLPARARLSAHHPGRGAPGAAAPLWLDAGGV